MEAIGITAAASAGCPSRACSSGPPGAAELAAIDGALGAAGLSNREIAEALFITRNTVETHLRHVYAKLDVENRLLLAERLANLQA